MTWIIEKTPKRWDEWVLENVLWLAGLFAAHQLIAMTVFAVLGTIPFVGGPMFDVWTFQFLLEDYLVFWGRWSMATTADGALRAGVGNALAWIVVLVALWRRIRTTGYEETTVQEDGGNDG